MASLLLVHGIASPGFVVEMNGVVALTGAATLPVGAVILALSALLATRRPRAVKPLLWLQAALMVGVVGLGWRRSGCRSSSRPCPSRRACLVIALLVVGLVFYGLLALRALRTVLLTRRRADLGVFVGLVWLAGALVPALLQSYMDLAWWLGHGLEVAGVLLVGVPRRTCFAPRRRVRSRWTFAAPSWSRPRRPSRLAGRWSSSAFAEKDEYTEGHTRRVALLAVEVGEEPGSSPRACASSPPAASSTTSASSRSPTRC